jgi:hypothetical protein
VDSSQLEIGRHKYREKRKPGTEMLKVMLLAHTVAAASSTCASRMGNFQASRITLPTAN